MLGPQARQAQREGYVDAKDMLTLHRVDGGVYGGGGVQVPWRV